MRTSISTILLASRATLDVYTRLPIEQDKSLHLGAGVGLYPFQPLLADAQMTLGYFWQGLAGYQWKVGPGQYQFFEVKTGSMRRMEDWEFMIVLSFGTSWF